MPPLFPVAISLLFLLLLLVALRREAPARLHRRLMGGIAFGLVAVRVLAEVGLMGDPREAFAGLALLGLGLVLATRFFHLPDAL